MIYDREALLNTLEAECFSDIGASAVIIGGHKVGKSYLLEHILTRPSDSSGNLYCRINVDLLKASGNGTLSDHVFLRFFLVLLLRQIDDLLERQRGEVTEWSGLLAQAEQKAIALADVMPDPAIDAIRLSQLNLAAAYRKKISQRQNEIEELASAAEALRRLTAGGKQVAVDELTEVLLQLRGLRKRIILVIDDYDHMVSQPGFTDNLFSFLRGANNEKKIIALVSSHKRLMDLKPEEHGAGGKESSANGKSLDRTSLFNHFQIQRLIPFRGKQPEAFLEWLGRPDGGDSLALGAEEKKYLRSLGGGCPHFLRYARSLYLQKRPLENDAARRQFENDHLVDEFHQVFEQIWTGCDEAERATLRAIADGATIEPGSADRLETEGYLMEDGPCLTIFSKLFADFIRKKPKPSASALVKPATPETGVPETLSVDEPLRFETNIPWDVFPSALFFATADAAANVGEIKIENCTGKKASIEVTCQLGPWSEVSTTADAFDPGPSLLPLQVDLRESVKTIRDPVWTRVDYSVTLDPGGANSVAKKRFKKVRLLPPDHFLFARWDSVRMELEDFSWLICAWVNSQEPRLAPVRERALDLFPRLGVPTEAVGDPGHFARQKVAAIYEALQGQKIRYFDNAVVFHSGNDQYMQRVQSCGKTIEIGTGNCLDGSVLFASLLSLCGVDPGILLMPGHAIAAWRAPGAAENDWQYVDTTGLPGLAFEQATALATARIDERQNGVQILAPAATLPDPENFATIVDVHHTIRTRRIAQI
ncbi:hypothetical protein [Edaphobacter aggregans]|nr:hypothetical protein [Edaphobacter aggregans]